MASLQSINFEIGAHVNSKELDALEKKLNELGKDYEFNIRANFDFNGLDVGLHKVKESFKGIEDIQEEITKIGKQFKLNGLSDAVKGFYKDLEGIKDGDIVNKGAIKEALSNLERLESRYKLAGNEVEAFARQIMGGQSNAVSFIKDGTKEINSILEKQIPKIKESLRTLMSDSINPAELDKARKALQEVFGADIAGKNGIELLKTFESVERIIGKLNKANTKYDRANRVISDSLSNSKKIGAFEIERVVIQHLSPSANAIFKFSQDIKNGVERYLARNPIEVNLKAAVLESQFNNVGTSFKRTVNDVTKELERNFQRIGNNLEKTASAAKDAFDKIAIEIKEILGNTDYDLGSYKKRTSKGSGRKSKKSSVDELFGSIEEEQKEDKPIEPVKRVTRTRKRETEEVTDRLLLSLLAVEGRDQAKGREYESRKRSIQKSISEFKSEPTKENAENIFGSEKFGGIDFYIKELNDAKQAIEASMSKYDVSDKANENIAKTRTAIDETIKFFTKTKDAIGKLDEGSSNAADELRKHIEDAEQLIAESQIKSGKITEFGTLKPTREPVVGASETKEETKAIEEEGKAAETAEMKIRSMAEAKSVMSKYNKALKPKDQNKIFADTSEILAENIEALAVARNNIDFALSGENEEDVIKQLEDRKKKINETIGKLSSIDANLNSSSKMSKAKNNQENINKVASSVDELMNSLRESPVGNLLMKIDIPVVTEPVAAEKPLSMDDLFGKQKEEVRETVEGKVKEKPIEAKIPVKIEPIVSGNELFNGLKQSGKDALAATKQIQQAVVSEDLSSLKGFFEGGGVMGMKNVITQAMDTMEPVMKRRAQSMLSSLTTVQMAFNELQENGSDLSGMEGFYVKMLGDANQYIDKLKEVYGLSSDIEHHAVGGEAGTTPTGQRIATIEASLANIYAKEIGSRPVGGGQVVGEGTATSDSIPAMLSNGEYVVNAFSNAIFRPILNVINGVKGGVTDINQLEKALAGLSKANPGIKAFSESLATIQRGGSLSVNQFNDIEFALRKILGLGVEYHALGGEIGKLVDNVRLYHGTTRDFDKFDISESDYGHSAAYFTDGFRMAKSYGEHVKDAILDLNSAYVIDAKGANWNDIKIDFLEGIDNPTIIDKAKAAILTSRVGIGNGEEKYDRLKLRSDLYPENEEYANAAENVGRQIKKSKEELALFEEKVSALENILSKYNVSAPLISGHFDIKGLIRKNGGTEEDAIFAETVSEIIKGKDSTINRTSTRALDRSLNDKDGIIIKNVTDYGAHGAAGEFKPHTVIITPKESVITDLKNTNDHFFDESSEKALGRVRLLDKIIDVRRSFPNMHDDKYSGMSNTELNEARGNYLKETGAFELLKTAITDILSDLRDISKNLGEDATEALGINDKIDQGERLLRALDAEKSRNNYRRFGLHSGLSYDYIYENLGYVEYHSLGAEVGGQKVEQKYRSSFGYSSDMFEKIFNETFKDLPQEIRDNALKNIGEAMGRGIVTKAMLQNTLAPYGIDRKGSFRFLEALNSDENIERQKNADATQAALRKSAEDEQKRIEDEAKAKEKAAADAEKARRKAEEDARKAEEKERLKSIPVSKFEKEEKTYWNGEAERSREAANEAMSKWNEATLNNLNKNKEKTSKKQMEILEQNANNAFDYSDKAASRKTVFDSSASKTNEQITAKIIELGEALKTCAQEDADGIKEQISAYKEILSARESEANGINTHLRSFKEAEAARAAEKKAAEEAAKAAEEAEKKNRAKWSNAKGGSDWGVVTREGFAGMNSISSAIENYKSLGKNELEAYIGYIKQLMYGIKRSYGLGEESADPAKLAEYENTWKKINELQSKKGGMRAIASSPYDSKEELESIISYVQTMYGKMDGLPKKVSDTLSGGKSVSADVAEEAAERERNAAAAEKEAEAIAKKRAEASKSVTISSDFSKAGTNEERISRDIKKINRLYDDLFSGADVDLNASKDSIKNLMSTISLAYGLGKENKGTDAYNNHIQMVKALQGVGSLDETTDPTGEKRQKAMEALQYMQQMYMAMNGISDATISNFGYSLERVVTESSSAASAAKSEKEALDELFGVKEKETEASEKSVSEHKKETEERKKTVEAAKEETEASEERASRRRGSSGGGSGSGGGGSRRRRVAEPEDGESDDDAVKEAMRAYFIDKMKSDLQDLQILSDNVGRKQKGGSLLGDAAKNAKEELDDVIEMMKEYIELGDGEKIEEFYGSGRDYGRIVKEWKHAFGFETLDKSMTQSMTDADTKLALYEQRLIKLRESYKNSTVSVGETTEDVNNSKAIALINEQLRLVQRIKALNDQDRKEAIDNAFKLKSLKDSDNNAIGFSTKEAEDAQAEAKREAKRIAKENEAKRKSSIEKTGTKKPEKEIDYLDKLKTELQNYEYLLKRVYRENASGNLIGEGSADAIKELEELITVLREVIDTKNQAAAKAFFDNTETRKRQDSYFKNEFGLDKLDTRLSGQLSDADIKIKQWEKTLRDLERQLSGETVKVGDKTVSVNNSRALELVREQLAVVERLKNTNDEDRKAAVDTALKMKSLRDERGNALGLSTKEIEEAHKASVNAAKEAARERARSEKKTTKKGDDSAEKRAAKAAAEHAAARVRLTNVINQCEAALTVMNAALSGANEETMPGIQANINTLEQLREKLRDIEMGSGELSKEEEKAFSEGIKGASGAQKGVNKLRQDIENLAQHTGGLKNAFANVFSIYAVKNFLKELVTVGGEFEKQHVALASMLGDASRADTMFSQMKSLAVDSPFTFQELTGFTKQLTAYSIPYEELYDTTKRLADISAGLGVDMSRIILAYGQVRSAEFLRGQELRQFTEAGIPLLDRLAAKFSALEGRVVSVGEVFKKISTRQVSFGMVKDVMWDLTDEGGQFYNMQAELTDTLSGSAAKMKDSYQIMLSEISESWGGVMRTFIDGTTSMMGHWKGLSVIVAGIAGAGMLKAIAGGLSLIFINGEKVFKLFKEGLMSSGVKGGLTALTSSLSGWVVIIQLAAAAIAAVTQAIMVFNEKRNKMNEANEAANSSIASESLNMKLLLEQIKKANSGTMERTKLVQKLNERYGEYLDHIVSEKEGYEAIEAAANKATEAITRKYRAQELEKKRQIIFDSRQEDLKNAKKIIKNSAMDTLKMGKTDASNFADWVEAQILSGVSENILNDMLKSRGIDKTIQEIVSFNGRDKHAVRGEYGIYWVDTSGIEKYYQILQEIEDEQRNLEEGGSFGYDVRWNQEIKDIQDKYKGPGGLIANAKTYSEEVELQKKMWQEIHSVLTEKYGQNDFSREASEAKNKIEELDKVTQQWVLDVNNIAMPSQSGGLVLQDFPELSANTTEDLGSQIAYFTRISQLAQGYDKDLKKLTETQSKAAKVGKTLSESDQQNIKDLEARINVISKILALFGVKWQDFVKEPTTTKKNKTTEEKLRDQIRLVQEAQREYKKWYDLLGDADKANEKLTSSGILTELFKENGFSKDVFDSNLSKSDALKNNLSIIQDSISKAVGSGKIKKDDAEKLRLEIQKVFSGIDFEDTSEEVQKAVARFKEVADQEAKDYDFEKSLFEKTGDSEWARDAATKNTMVWDDVTRAWFERLKSDSGKTDIPLNMKPTDAEEFFGKGKDLDLYNQMIQRLESNATNLKNELADAFSALPEAVQHQTRLNAINKKYEKSLANVSNEHDKNLLKIKQQSDILEEQVKYWKSNAMNDYRINNLSTLSKSELSKLKESLQSVLDDVDMSSIPSEKLKEYREMLRKIEEEGLNKSIFINVTKFAKESADAVSDLTQKEARLVEEKRKLKELEEELAELQKNNANPQVIYAAQVAVETQKQAVVDCENGVKEAAETATDSVTRLKSATDALMNNASKIGGIISSIGGEISGSLGNAISKMGSSISSVGDIYSKVGKGGWSAAEGYVQAVLQIYQVSVALDEAVTEARDNLYNDAAKKQAGINAMTDAVYAYAEAVMKSKQAENNWFSSTSFGSISDSMEQIELAQKAYTAKMKEAQEIYHNKQSSGWGNYFLAGLVTAAAVVVSIYSFGAAAGAAAAATAAAWGTVAGVAAAGIYAGAEAIYDSINYAEGKIAAFRNLKITTRTKDKGWWQTGWGGHDEVTQSLDDFLKDAEKIYNAYLTYLSSGGSDLAKAAYDRAVEATGYGSELKEQLAKAMLDAGIDNFNLWDGTNYDGTARLNTELAKSLLENEDIAGRMSGETRKTLEYLVQQQEKIDEAMKSIRDVVSDMFSPLVDNFVSAIWDWFDEGKDVMDSFKDYASDTFRDIATEMIKTMLVETVFNKYKDDLANILMFYSANKNEDWAASWLATAAGNIAGEIANKLAAAADVAQVMISSLDASLKANGYANGLSKTDDTLATDDISGSFNSLLKDINSSVADFVKEFNKTASNKLIDNMLERKGFNKKLKGLEEDLNSFIENASVHMSEADLAAALDGFSEKYKKLSEEALRTVEMFYKATDQWNEYFTEKMLGISFKSLADNLSSALDSTGGAMSKFLSDLKEQIATKALNSLLDSSGFNTVLEEFTVKIAQQIENNTFDKESFDTEYSEILNWLAELINQINEKFGTGLENIVKVTMDSFVDNVVSGMSDASKTVKDMVSDMRQKMFEATMSNWMDNSGMNDKLEEWYKMWADAESDGTIEQKRDELLALYEKIMEEIKLKSDEYAEGYGINTSTDGTLTSSIKGVTEETANILAAYMNAIRQDVSVERYLLEQIVGRLGIVADNTAVDSLLTTGGTYTIGSGYAGISSGEDEELGSSVIELAMQSLVYEQIPMMNVTASSQLAQLEMQTEYLRQINMLNQNIDQNVSTMRSYVSGIANGTYSIKVK